jgi:hypothetical protein
MIRLLVVLFWVSLIVGTYVTGNVVGNWVVCLLALFFFVRSRRRREPHGPSTEGTPAAEVATRAVSAGPLSPVSPAGNVPQAQHPARSHPPRPRWR